MASKAKAAAAAAAPAKMGTLQIKVKAAYTLENKDTGILGDKSDPYVAVRLGKVEQKTPVIKDNLDPVWTKDNVFSFDVMSLDDSIVLEVFNKCNLKSDQTLGKCSIGLKTLKRCAWAPLKAKFDDGKDGQLEFEVRLDVAAAPMLVLVADPSAEKDRITKMIMAASSKAPAKLAPYISQAAPFIAAAVVYFLVALPYFVKALSVAQELFASLPTNILYAVMGFVICFFGGVFPATIAAVEAWNLCGGTEALNSCKQLYGEFVKVLDKNKEDNKVDADGDGIADVNQIGETQLLTRKMMLAVKAVEPETVNGAIGCILTGWMGVLATLKIRFARVVTLGQVIGDILLKVASPLEPALKNVVPDEYHSWVPVSIAWVTKLVAVSVAWWIERIISAVHSSIRGGLMFARSLLAFLNEKGLVKFEDHNASYMDEAIGWSVAAVGFVFQFMMGFSAPFPLNILLMPVSTVEYFIMWSVAS